MTASKRLDVLSFGEALVDMFPDRRGIRLRDAAYFAPQVGGAPANLAYGVATAGGRSGLMGKVGDDEFGELACAALTAAGVNCDCVGRAKGVRTGLAFVQVDADGERSFTFYRNPSAEMTLVATDVDFDVIAGACIVHSGTNLMRAEGPAEATLLALDHGRASGAITSLDANLRAHLWSDPAQMVARVLEALTRVDILKANDDELEYLFGSRDAAAVYAEHLAPRGVGALVMTKGEHGADLATRTLFISEPAPSVEALDTTGAGDAFLAGLLLAVARFCPDGRTGLEALEPEAWRSAVLLGNFMGSQVCRAFGAVAALPPRDSIPFSTFNVPTETRGGQS